MHIHDISSRVATKMYITREDGGLGPMRGTHTEVSQVIQHSRLLIPIEFTINK